MAIMPSAVLARARLRAPIAVITTILTPVDSLRCVVCTEQAVRGCKSFQILQQLLDLFLTHSPTFFPAVSANFSPMRWAAKRSFLPSSGSDCSTFSR